MHPLLQRQLRKLGLETGRAPTDAQWTELLERIGRTYEQADQDRYTIERSLMISSHEMQDMCTQVTRSEKNFKELVEQSPDPVFARDGNTILYANAAMARLLGCDSPTDLVGTNSLDFVHPDDAEELLAKRRLCAQGHAGVHVAIRWVRRDGSTVTVEGGSTEITFDGAPAWLTIVRDVTEQRRAKHELERVATDLRLSEERYRVLFHGMPLPILLFDPVTLQILQANDAALQLYGYSQAELLALTVRDLKVEREDAELKRVGETALTLLSERREVLWRGVKQHRRKDGSVMDLDITSHVITVGGRQAILAQYIDITEKLRLEEQLRQSQKMEAVGRLAGGIAHDFNNILAVILADADFLKEETGEGSELRPHLEEIESAAMRAASLTHQLLAFSRRQVLQPRTLSLNTVVTEMDRMLRRLIGEDIRLDMMLAPELRAVKADPGQLEQVIMNLVVNARDSVASGGRVTIRTSSVEDGKGRARPPEISGDCVLLTVSDNGTGIDEKTLGRIFEPFFTTKEVGKGTGLGLATVFGIVKQSGGIVQVESAIGRGSDFHVYLPCAASDGIVPSVRSSREIPAAGTENVLLVEDDPFVRRAVTQALERRGYKVVQADNGEDAVERFRTGAAAFDIVVTDLVMPGIDGVAVAELLREVKPKLPVLYISGYTEHAALRNGEFGERTACLTKPFTSDELAVALQNVLRACA